MIEIEIRAKGESINDALRQFYEAFGKITSEPVKTPEPEKITAPAVKNPEPAVKTPEPEKTTEPAVEKPVETVTMEECRTALSQLADIKGREAVRGIFKKLGVRSFPDIEPERYPETIRLTMEAIHAS